MYGKTQAVRFPAEGIVSRLERINKLGETSGQTVSYNQSIIKEKRLSAIVAETNNMEEWLYKSLVDTDLTYRKVREKYYSVFIKPEEKASEAIDQEQKKGILTGKVVDEYGEGLPGATVKVAEQNMGTATDVNGNFRLSLAVGIYTIEVGYIGYQTQRITDVRIKDGSSTPLDVALNVESQSLSEVVVTATYNKATTGGLLRVQQNAPGVTSGLSSQQISALPDKNVGEALKRISGVSTIDNKKVVVRGISERYNVAQLDGVTLPSTDVQERSFDFNIIPSNLVDNIIVAKSYTPDMGFGFGGGLVQISTLAIPDENFLNVSAGMKYVPGVTGKTMLGNGRGRWDYLGFDDGVRNHFPGEYVLINNNNYSYTDPYDPNNTVTHEMIREQNKKIGDLSRIGARKYTAMPGQNYSISLGKTYGLGRNNSSRLGFVTALSYRNEQTIEEYPYYNQGSFSQYTGMYDAEGRLLQKNHANNYKFNTTISGIVNIGWESRNHKIISRNMYSRVFDNSFFRIVGRDSQDDADDYMIVQGVGLPKIREYESPNFIDLLQNKLEGEHTFGKLTFTWSAARSKIVNDELDATEAYLIPVEFANVKLKDAGKKFSYEFDDDYSFYKYVLGSYQSERTYFPALSRSRYLYDEVNKTVETSLSYKFNVGITRNIIKGGYNFLVRHGNFSWTYLPFAGKGEDEAGVPIPLKDISIDFEDPKTSGFYFPRDYDHQRYEGKNTNVAYYGMADTRIGKWARIVWGLRAESYVYKKIYSQATNIYDWAEMNPDGTEKATYYVNEETGDIVSKNTDAEKDELKWRHLPSVSVTLTPLRDLNFRTSYAKSVVRPGLIENSRFTRFNPKWGKDQINTGGILSTQIEHFDTKLEWYPQAGDLLSVGYFRKNFENPVEIYQGVFDTGGKLKIMTQNSKSAKVRGWEFELRKSLDFIAPNVEELTNFYISGNLTSQKSEVQARFFDIFMLGMDAKGNDYYARKERLLKQKRPLYGYVPFLYNIGLQYAGERLGVNVAYNYIGNQVFAVSSWPSHFEYQRERDQLDAQVSYKFLKDKKLQVKLNLSNLLNSPYHFYRNGDTFTYENNSYFWDSIKWDYGFDENYQWGYLHESPFGGTTLPDGTKAQVRTGDIDTAIKKTGMSISVSASYTF
jgi:hypothetical protein